METEEVHSLASLLQVHDPRLGLLELEPQLFEDRRERRKRLFGFLSTVAERQ